MQKNKKTSETHFLRLLTLSCDGWRLPRQAVTSATSWPTWGTPSSPVEETMTQFRYVLGDPQVTANNHATFVMQIQSRLRDYLRLLLGRALPL